MSMAPTKTKPVTAEEFERIEDGWRYDLICGEVQESETMPGEEHGSITNLFTVYVRVFVRDQRLGRCYAAETRFIIERNPDTVLAPDWAFIAKGRLPQEAESGFGEVIPDAILEVRSPSDTKQGVQRKVTRWLNAGVRLMWELDPATRLLTVYRPGQEPRTLGIEDTLSGEDVLPGFALPLRRLFGDE